MAWRNRPRAAQTAAWTDIDNDGLVNLFVGNEDSPSQLFRNRGDGTFEDIAASAGVARTSFTKAVHAGDFDNDGYQDLYVSEPSGRATCCIATITIGLFRSQRARPA